MRKMFKAFRKRLEGIAGASATATATASSSAPVKKESESESTPAAKAAKTSDLPVPLKRRYELGGSTKTEPPAKKPKAEDTP
jgi:hypothetical protein